MAHDVFISHSTIDKKIAEEVCMILERNNISCWMAPRDIIPGQDYAEGIMDGISECSIMVVIYSHNSNTSKHVWREIERAANYNKSIIPFRIENVPPTKAMEYWLSTPHWIDAITDEANTTELESHIERLVQTINTLFHRGESKEDSVPNLGLMYDKGEGVKRDLKVAVSWYRKAAQQGHREAKIKNAKLEKSDNKIIDMHSISDTRKPIRLQVTMDQIKYTLPSPDILEDNPEAEVREKALEVDTIKDANQLKEILSSFGIEVDIIKVIRGIVITRYEIRPKQSNKVSKITKLSDDIALNLGVDHIRIELPLPGKSVIGIEVPNNIIYKMYLKEILKPEGYFTFSSKLDFVLGIDVMGNAVNADLCKMPHLLLAGASGLDKSMFFHSFILSILFRSLPQEVKFLMIDPMGQELNVYNGIPNMITPVVVDAGKAVNALKWVVDEMTNRYHLFGEIGVLDIHSYNGSSLNDEKKIKLPYIIVVISELTDLMLADPKQTEDNICRLAQLARASGIHLVIGTRRPSVNVLTGIITVMIPSKIAFAVPTKAESQTILNTSGAEVLLGKGDMLFWPAGSQKPIRVQSPYVSYKEIDRVAGFLKAQWDQAYHQNIIDSINNEVGDTAGLDDCDKLFEKAVYIALDIGLVSVELLQKQLRIGYARASRIMDQMQEKNIVSPPNGKKPRQVLITKKQWEQRNE